MTKRKRIADSARFGLFWGCVVMIGMLLAPKPWATAPRWMHYIYADVHGYFWIPCDFCGRNFGGHESGGTWYESPGYGVGICSLHPEKYYYGPHRIPGSVAFRDFVRERAPGLRVE